MVTCDSLPPAVLGALAAADVDGEAAATEGAGVCCEVAGELVTAAGAGAGRVELVGEDLVVVADDEGLAAAGAEGGVALDVVDVAGVDVEEAGAAGDGATNGRVIATVSMSRSGRGMNSSGTSESSSRQRTAICPASSLARNGSRRRSAQALTVL